MANGYKQYWSKKNLEFIDEIKSLQEQFDTSLSGVRGFTEAAAAVEPARIKYPDWKVLERETLMSRVQAWDYGYDLEEGYQLKLTPQTGGVGTASILTPQGWEVTKDSYISPEGKVFGIDDVVILDAEGKGYTEGEWETHVAEMAALKGQTEDVPVEMQAAMDTLLQIFTEDEIAGLDDIDEEEAKRLEQGIRHLGRSAETEALVNLLLTNPQTGELPNEQQMANFFAPLSAFPVGSYSVVGQTIDDLRQLAWDDPELLRQAFLYEGRSPETEQLLREVYGNDARMTTAYMADFFLDNLGGRFVRGEWLPDAVEDYWRLYWGGTGDLVASLSGTFDRLGSDSLSKTLTNIGLEGKLIAYDVNMGERGSPEWYAKNLARMTPMMLAIVEMALLGGAGAGAVAKAAGGGAFVVKMMTVIGGGVTASIGEGTLEAGNAFLEAKRRGLTIEECNRIHDTVQRENFALLSVTNTAQFGLAFFSPAGVAAKLLVKGLIFGFQALSEGGEEVAQLYITRKAFGDPQQFDEEFWDNFRLGVAGGVAFGVAGSIYQNVQDRVHGKMTPLERVAYNKDVANNLAQGQSQKQAENNAFNTFTEKPDTDQRINDAIDEVRKENEAEAKEEGVTAREAVNQVFDKGKKLSGQQEEIVKRHTAKLNPRPEPTSNVRLDVSTIPQLSRQDVPELDALQWKGMKVYHGELPLRKGEKVATDAGDLGRGIYYSSSESVARAHAGKKNVTVKNLVISRPLIISEADAYSILVEEYKTVNAPTMEDRISEAQKLTDDMIAQGYDGLVSVRLMKDGTRQYEIVDYSPYMEKGAGELAAQGMPSEIPVNQPTSIDNVVKRQDIIKMLSETLNVPIRRGHFRGKKGVVGIFKIKSEIIRLKVGGLDTVAHEVGHLIDFRFHLSENIGQDEGLNLLVAYHKPRNPQIEAFGEYIGYYITDPNKLPDMCPNFHAFMENWLQNNPDIEAVINTARDDYARWKALPPTAQVISMMDATPEPRKLPWNEKFKKMYTWAFDQIYPIRDFVKQAQKLGVEVSPLEDPYIQSRLIMGLPVRMDLIFNYGTLNPDYWIMERKGKVDRAKIEYTGKSLRELLQPVKDHITEFQAYLIDRRVIQLWKRNINAGVPLETAMASVMELDAKYPEFKGAAQDLYAFQTRILEYGRKSGLYTQETMDRLLEISKEYVPFHRVMEGLEVRGYMGKKMADIRSQLHRIGESERVIINPLESVIKDTYAIVDASDRHMVGVKMVKLAKRGGVLAQSFEEISPPMAIVARVTAKDLGIDIEGMTEEQLNQMVNIFRTRFFNAGENILSINDEGHQKFYQVEPELYKAMEAIDREHVSTIIKFLAYPAKWLRAGAVLSPDFWAYKNPWRDTMTAFTYSRFGFIPIVDTIRGTFHVLRKDSAYQLYMASGAGRAMLTSMDRDYVHSTLEEVTNGRRKVEYVKHPLDALERLAEFTELGTRMGEFMRGIGKGVTPVEAGFGSREVTLDFAVAGSQMQAMRMITAFWNANMRAMDKLVREARYHPASFFSKTLLGITLPSLMLLFFNMKDDRWKEIPRWEKDLFWILFVGDKIIRIPKPFELGILFGSVPERIVEYILSNDPHAFDEMWRNLREASLPSILPTFIMPVIENMTNWSFFRERDLVSEGLTDERPEWQYTQYTPEAIKLMGKWLNLSPIKIENFIRGYTASLGNYAIDALDAILIGTGIVPEIPKPTKELADLPVVRAIVTRDPYGSRGASVTRFYNELDKYNADESHLKNLLEHGWSKRYDDFISKHPEYAFVFDYETGELYSMTARYLRQQASELAYYRKEQRKIYEHPTMTPDEKKAKIDEINKIMTRIAVDTLAFLDNPQLDMADVVHPAAPDFLLYKYMGVLPAYLRDYVWANKASIDSTHIRDNLPMVEVWRKSDGDLTDRYRTETKDKTDRFADDFLYNNPEIDVALNFSGHLTTVHSLDAMYLLQERATAMGIPFEAFNAISPENELILTIQLAWREQILERNDYGDKDSPLYIEDKDKRLAAYDALDSKHLDKDGFSTFKDARSRIKIIGLGAIDETMIEDYVSHNRIVQQYGASSSQAILDLIGHPELHSWGQSDDTFGWSDYKDELLGVHTINVQWWDFDKEYNGYGDIDSPKYYIAPDADGTTRTREAARDKLLSDNLAYAQDRYRRDAMKMRLPDKYIEDYVYFHFLPDEGFYKLRYRQEHPLFDAAVKVAMERAGKKAWMDLTPLNIPPVEYDEIRKDWADDFFAYDNAQGNDVQRANIRQGLFNDPTKEGFERAWYMIRALDKGFGGSTVTIADAVVYMQSQQGLFTSPEDVADYNQILLALSLLQDNTLDTGIANSAMAVLESRLQANEQAMETITDRAKETGLSPRSYPDYIQMSQMNVEMSMVLEMLRVPDKWAGTGMEMVDKYADYFLLPDSSSTHGEMVKDKERFLKANMDLYEMFFTLDLWEKPIDFDRVPSETLESALNNYFGGNADRDVRMAKRCASPELDAYLVKYEGYVAAYGTHKYTGLPKPEGTEGGDEIYEVRKFIEELFP